MTYIEDEPSILCGPTPTSHGPGTKQFDGLVKSVATSATRVGEAANYGLFYWRVLPHDIRLAADKIREAVGPEKFAPLAAALQIPDH